MKIGHEIPIGNTFDLSYEKCVRIESPYLLSVILREEDLVRGYEQVGQYFE
jgi:hypothetical protein